MPDGDTTTWHNVDPQLPRPTGITSALYQYLCKMTALLLVDRPNYPGQYPCYEALVLAKGRPYEAIALPPFVVPGPLKLYYSNTLSLIREWNRGHHGFTLTYVKGSPSRSATENA